jgi:hypothetical protein
MLPRASFTWPSRAASTRFPTTRSRASGESFGLGDKGALDGFVGSFFDGISIFTLCRPLANKVAKAPGVLYSVGSGFAWIPAVDDSPLEFRDSLR